MSKVFIPQTRFYKVPKAPPKHARKRVMVVAIVNIESFTAGAAINAQGDFSAYCVVRNLEVFEDQLTPYTGSESVWGAAEA